MKSRSKLAKTIFIAVPIFVLAGLSLIAYSVINKQSNVGAVSATDFNAGNIISDSVFYNKDAMNAQQIQDFLNKLLPSCYPYGQTSVSGFNPPYVCLKDYYENPSTGENSFTKDSPGSFSGGISAAQIIYNAAQEYGINPQVLLVLLKKESLGPLTSDTWPVANQYKFAMGYACPDSGPDNTANCDSSKSGFYKQIRAAAWQLNYYKNHPNDYRYSIGWNDIQYSPNTACGTKRVYIENIATLSLYIYTPYTPNDAALANYPGTADCGAYGNRNFFMFFNEWFGSAHYESVENIKNAVWRLYNPKSGGHFFSANYTEVNTYLMNGWKSDGIVSYSSDNGDISVHRLYNPKTNYHILSSNSAEINSLKSQGWKDDGEIFKANSSGKPVWRLSNKGRYFATNNTDELSIYKNAGWNIDGISYYEISEYEISTWRLYNKTTGYHILVASANELTDYIRAGWTSDGIIMSSSKSDTTPVYRLWNGKSHFITASEVEKNNYIKAGWKNDGIIFYTNNAVIAHRLYNSQTNSHRVSINSSTINKLLNEGWKDDGGIFKASSRNGIPIYELTKPTTKSFFYTSNVSEMNTYISAGWSSNGVVFYTPDNGLPIYRLYSAISNAHILIRSESEKQAYINAGWVNDGIIFNSYLFD